MDNFHLMQEEFYFGLCCYMLRKSSALTPMLNDFILRVVESGLAYYWESEGALLYMDSNVQKAMRYDRRQQTVHKLKLTNVEGAFAILCLGHLISLIVFFVELLVFRRENTEKQQTSLPI
ncbi:unnamed protein product [Acanthoscelides obtectus]|uniref:Uncharacterized protein n=1 Tax=Acanthoscelides obtectus TaxID=200917 RepID=A0A9P0JR48_ACAOB|nr:unnamed protein product [Acanthoscelides obtectus]CAK1672803.1 hypothetical protein AOBTE_LOCUS29096 [Acanthoscelides obtectus]